MGSEPFKCVGWLGKVVDRGCALAKESRKIVSKNRKAYHDYIVLDTYEAGIALAGTEVKSIRQGKVNLRDSFAVVDGGQLVLVGMHISPYDHGNIFNQDPVRKRVLLMHKREIMRLYGLVKQEGLTLVPLSVYLKAQRVKVELGLCKGKRVHDKRAAMAERDAQREIERGLKERAQ